MTYDALRQSQYLIGQSPRGSKLRGKSLDTAQQQAQSQVGSSTTALSSIRAITSQKSSDIQRKKRLAS